MQESSPSPTENSVMLLSKLDQIKGELGKIDQDRLETLVLHDVKNLYNIVASAIKLYKSEYPNSNTLPITKALSLAQIDFSSLDLATIEKVAIIRQIFLWFEILVGRTSLNGIQTDRNFMVFFATVYKKTLDCLPLSAKVNNATVDSADFFLGPTLEKLAALQTHTLSFMDLLKAINSPNGNWSPKLRAIVLDGKEIVMFFNHLKNAIKQEEHFFNPKIDIDLSEDGRTIIIINRSREPYGSLTERAQLPTDAGATNHFGTYIMTTLAKLGEITIEHRDKQVDDRTDRHNHSYHLNTFSFTKSTSWLPQKIQT